MPRIASLGRLPTYPLSLASLRFPCRYGEGDSEDQKIAASKFIIDPHGTFRMCWDVWMAFVLVYIAFYVPYRVCLYWDDGELSSTLEDVELASDIIFWIDMALNFNTATIDKDGKLVTSRRLIAIAYIKGFFFLDLVASFPFQYVLRASEASAEER